MFPPGWCEPGRRWGTARGRGHHGSSPSSEPAQEPLQQARGERCGTIPVHSGALGVGEVPSPSPQTPVEPFPLQPCGFMSKHSACGHAMTSEEKYTWFLSDVRGYGFINWWNTCQQKLLSSPAAFRSYWQMYCFQRPCVENLCSTLFFVPPEITRFLLRSIITSYLIEMWPDQNKAGPLKGLQRGGHLPCKNCTRVWWIGCFQSFFRCIKKKITAIRLTTERFLPISKTIIAHDVWVTNTS